MNKRFLLVLLLLASRYCFAFDFSAVCETGQTLYYEIVEGTNKVNIVAPDYGYDGYEKPSGNIILPSTVGFEGRTYTVVAISGSAFAFCSGLTGSLTIPNTIETISYDAFYMCSGLSGALVLNEGLVEIGTSAFDGCSGLTGTLVLPQTLRYISSDAFAECSGFTGDLVIPNSVASVGSYAFVRCSGFDGHLTLSESLYSIEDGTFYKCSGLTGDLVIPDAVNRIEKNAFANCSAFDGELVLPESLGYISQSAFEGCSGLKGDLHLPESLRYVSTSAFENCSGFTGSLHLPSKMTSVSSSAFRGCTGFTGDLVFPETMQTIGSYAFCNCSGLSGRLVFPASLEHIEKYAFDSCGIFTELIVQSLTPPVADDAAFEGLQVDLSVHVNCGCAAFYRIMPQWKNFTNYFEDFIFAFSVRPDAPELGNVVCSHAPDCDDNRAIMEAFPAQGQRFYFWTRNGEIISLNPKLVITVDGNAEFVAHFSEFSVDESESCSFSVFPNPVSDKFTVKGENISRIDLYDMTGKRVKSVYANSESNCVGVDVEGLDKGIYCVSVISENGKKVAVKKVVID